MYWRSPELGECYETDATHATTQIHTYSPKGSTRRAHRGPRSWVVAEKSQSIHVDNMDIRNISGEGAFSSPGVVELGLEGGDFFQSHLKLHGLQLMDGGLAFMQVSRNSSGYLPIRADSSF